LKIPRKSISDFGVFPQQKEIINNNVQVEQRVEFQNATESSSDVDDKERLSPSFHEDSQPIKIE